MRLRARVSRRTLLAGGVALAGAGAGAGLLRGMEPVAAAGTADTDILTNLVLLEDQAAFVCGQLAAPLASLQPSPVASPGSKPLDAVTVLPSLVQLHADHRDVLMQALRALGGVAPSVGAAYPRLVPTGSDKASVLAALGKLESGLLGALYGALGGLKTVATAAQVASVFAVTARLQSVVLAAQGRPPVPASFVTGDPSAASAVVVPGGAAVSGGSGSPSSSSSSTGGGASTSSGAAGTSSGSATRSASSSTSS